MSTQVIGTVRRSRIIAALLALALALAVVAVATQASSIWSSRIGTGLQPAMQVAPAGNLNVREVHLPRGCHRPKYGCEHNQDSTTKP
jgi:hypothetical protein